MKFPKLKESVRVTRCRVKDGMFELRIGLFHEEGLILSGPGYLPAALALMDGSRSLDQMCRSLEGCSPRPTRVHLESLCESLREKGLVEERPVCGASALLGADRAQRYRKHLLFYGLSVDEDSAAGMQERLAGLQVALIGLGGIGSALAYHLAAAGVGRLRGVDPDRVELSNLTRQVLYRSSDLGRLKVEAARERLAEYNPEVAFEPVARRMDGPDDLVEAVSGCALALLSADTPPAIARWMNEAAVRSNVPFLITGYFGRVAVCGPMVVPGRTPCLACARRSTEDAVSSPEVDAINSRFSVPSFGPINHLSAALAAGEALKFLAGYREPSVLGARVIFDPFSMQTRRVEARRNPDWEICA